MSSFAAGKKAKAISDRSGMAFPYNEMIKEWNGLFVHRSEFESKHPQLQPRAHSADAQALRDARTDRTETAVLILLQPDPFETVAASASYINVYEKGHGRSTSDTVRFRGPYKTGSFQTPATFDGITGSNLTKSAGYSITVGKRSSSGSVSETADYYYFSIDTDTATSGGIKGGGENCSSGPVTLVK